MTTYVLLLEDNKYYIGKTTQLQHRLNKHFSGDGCRVTQRWKPIECLKTWKGDREREIYLIAKERYGAENVFGAGHTQSK